MPWVIEGSSVSADPHKPSLGEGAGDAAPTAPHATGPSPGAPRTGPTRFWDGRRVRRALAFTLAMSVAVHYALAPWSLFPERKLEFREVEGELTIAIDTMSEPAPPPPEAPPPAPPPVPTPEAEGPGSTKRDAGPNPPRDAGRDAAKERARDAGSDADVELEDGGALPLVARDAGAPGSSDGGEPRDGGDSIALADASGLPPGANGPRDPQAMIGAAGAVQADVPLVQLLVNVAEIRKHPVGAKMGPLLSAIPEWDEYIAGTNVDPVRDTDWILVNGPSLYSKRTSRIAIIIHYSTSDALVDKAVQHLSKKHPSGGPFDAGVPGVKAYLGHADFAPRVFLRPQSHVLAIVPPDYANTAAKILSKARIGIKVQPGEAMRLTLRNPSRPMPFLSPNIREMRLWIVPRADGGADVHAEGDVPDSAEAEKVAKEIKKLVREQNSLGVQMITQGILNRTEVSADGAVVRLHVPATEAQIQAILDFVMAYLGVGKPR